LLLRQGVLFAAGDEWLFGLDDGPAAGTFGGGGLTGPEAFLRLALYLFDVGAAEFALVFFQVGGEAGMALEVLIADVAFGQW
jgi:hypothetical protein